LTDGKDAEASFDLFIELYETKYDKAVGCLKQDRDALQAFHGFPAEHWKHLRTTHPTESTFATVRHRTIPPKGRLSKKTALAMAFKLIEGALKTWRCLEGPKTRCWRCWRATAQWASPSSESRASPHARLRLSRAGP
jgi:hypothetical protein